MRLALAVMRLDPSPSRRHRAPTDSTSSITRRAECACRHRPREVAPPARCSVPISSQARKDDIRSLDDRPRTRERSRMEHEMRDITIIGGGPAGLFALFYAGMRGATAQIVDALPELGGQLAALYPEKYIFDVAGYPKVLAKDLVKALAEQAARWGYPMHLGQRVIGLAEVDDHFVLETDHARFPSRSIVIAAGIGAFSP